MDTTTNRTGAVWVAGTGAFLLLAATALFVAVRWDDLPDAGKLGVVGALTGAFLLGGRALARTLPATGDVLFHLGALLIPVDVAAIAVRLELDWRGLLLAEGVAAGAALAALAAASGSVVLLWAAGAAAVAVAAGVAGLSPLPAPLVLVVAAGAAALVGPSPAVEGGVERPRSRRGAPGVRQLALSWATVGGLAPMISVVAAELLRVGLADGGVGVLTELGLAGRAAGWAAFGSGALAAVLIGREARVREDSALAGLAVVVLVAGVLTAGVAADLSGASLKIALPGLFVAVEAGALVARRDPFWGPVVAGAAWLAEVPALLIGWTAAMWCFLWAPSWNNVRFFSEYAEAQPVGGVALGLLALGWFLMGARQQPLAGGAPLFRSVQDAAATYAWLVAPAAIAAVAVGTASGPATAATCLGLAAVLATASHRSARLVGAVLVLFAPLTTVRWQAATVVAGLAGAAVATWSVRNVDRRLTSGEPMLLTVTAVAAALGGCAAGSLDGGIVLTSVLAVSACFGIAAALEPAAVLPGVARAGAVVAAVAVTVAEPHGALPAVGLATVLAVAEAVRRHNSMIGFGAAATVQLMVVDVARRAGLDTAATGLTLCIAAVVWAGLALVVDGRWRLPLLAAACAGLAAGVLLSGDDPRTHANALLIAGGLVAAGGVAAARPGVVGAGSGILCLAIGAHLELSDVRAADAYVAPVAALLTGTGFHLRRTANERLSSWVAYAPAVVLLGGVALVERIAGGGGVHALVAGAVGIVAVAAGGGRRLSGPLFSGTLLLVGVTIHESLGTLASVPTWGWLALGGSLLLAIGIGLERRGTSGPVEAGRRLVDVIAERFS